MFNTDTLTGSKPEQYAQLLAQAGAQADLQALLPKGMQLARDNMERLASANQEVLGLSLKTGEALGALVRQPFAAKSERKTR